jgi:SHS2 domain-containing protein
MSGRGSFRFVEGATSDLAFAASGASIEEVFFAAADALLAATVEHPEAVEERVVRSLHFTDDDLELLLLRFLNELIWLRDAEGLLLRVTRLACRTDGRIELRAELAGEPLDPVRHERACDVKAATAHGLAFARVGDAWQAHVTLDV